MRDDSNYPEPFTHEQYGVFTTTKDGDIKFIASCVSADSALNKAVLYYHRMNSHEQNDMDMSEIERFYVRIRHVTYSLWDDEVISAKDAIDENNPWRISGKHWND